MRWPPGVRIFDVLLACTLAALGVAEVAVPFESVMGDGSPVLAGALAVGTSLMLILRRRHPLATVAVVMLSWSVLSVLTPMLILFWGALAPMAVAVFSVARHGRGRVPVVGAGLAAASMLLLNVMVDGLDDPGELFFPWLVLICAWLAGWIIRRQVIRAQTYERRALGVEEQARERTLIAIAEERARIARELHDVVAHTVTAIVVQAGAASQVVDDDPAYVRASLDRIRQTGSEALDEMRRVVTLLREREHQELLTPQPGLANLEALIEGARTGGAEVRLHIDGEPRALPAGADLAAYRIVQEALTNVHRHSGASRVDVTVRYGPDSVELDIRDDGVGREPTLEGRDSGHGLLGMRERASMYGGQVAVTTAPNSGFQVHAVLPLSLEAT